MDTDRGLKFSIPPLVMFLSLLFGALTTPGGPDRIESILTKFGKDNIGGAIVAAVTGGSLLVASGFLISVLGYVLLREVLKRVYHCGHLRDTDDEDAVGWCADYLSPKDFQAFAALIAPHSLKKLKYSKHGFCVMSWIAHSENYLESGMRDWFLRRWNTLLVHVHSVVALFLAYILGALLVPGAACNAWWIGFSLISIAFLVVNAWNARKESNDMWHFLAILLPEEERRRNEPRAPEAQSGNPDPKAQKTAGRPSSPRKKNK